MSGRDGTEIQEPKRVDLSQTRRVHVVGVGGAGMSAIAYVLHAMGHRVTGSDLKASPALDRLAASGVEVAVGHDGVLMDDAEILSVSTAVPDDNHEVLLARERGLLVATRAETLSAICACRRVIAVSGTHGKTTTTTLLALTLVEAGWSPSFLIGGDVNEIGTNAVWDKGEWLVVEADESDGTFLALDPEVSVLTNAEPDHLDHYGDFDRLVAAFEEFCEKATTAVVTSADDSVAAGIGRRHRAVSSAHRKRPPIGSQILHPDVKGCLSTWCTNPNCSAALRFRCPVRSSPKRGRGRFHRDHPRRPIRRGAARVRPVRRVARRFEHRGEALGVRFVDDYAHLPTEVGAVLAAARTTTQGRVVVVFQPHRYSRTEAVWEQFADAFTAADEVVVTDVYAAGEQPVPGVTGKLIADAVVAAHPGASVHYVPERDQVAVGGRHVAPVRRPLHHSRGRGPDQALRRAIEGALVVTDPASALGKLAHALGERAATDAPLGARTTYRVGGTAALMVEADDEETLIACHRALMTAGAGVPVLVIGKGSNVLAADSGFAGVCDLPRRGVRGLQDRRDKCFCRGRCRYAGASSGYRGRRSGGVRVGGRHPGFARRCRPHECRGARIRVE